MAELAKKSVTELTELLGKKRAALGAFRFSASGSKTRNVREGRGLRKEIAQILTELRGRT